MHPPGPGRLRRPARTRHGPLLGSADLGVSCPLLCPVVLSCARGHDDPTGMPEQLREIQKLERCSWEIGEYRGGMGSMVAPQPRPRRQTRRAAGDLRAPIAQSWAFLVLFTKRTDTVGQPPSAEIWVSKMPSLKAKKLMK